MFALLHLNFRINMDNNGVALLQGMSYCWLLFLKCLSCYVSELRECEDKWREASMEQSLLQQNLFGIQTGLEILAKHS
jgi:hypothetical protein